MRLRTLGALELSNSSFRAHQPLLLLAFLSLSGKEVRAEIADLFWPQQLNRGLRLKNLSEALRRLRKISPDLVETLGSTGVRVHIQTDVTEFLRALERGEFGKAIELYRGLFLPGVERDKRFELGLELEEWIISTRQALQERVTDAMLTLAEKCALERDFEGGARLARRAFGLDRGVTYPSQEDYRRMYALLLAGERLNDAGQVEVEAAGLYDQLELCRTPREARDRLALTHGLPPKSGIFVGRKRELRDLLVYLFAENPRVLTLVGAPGVGKTTLAVRLAWTARGHFRGGVYFVPLEALPGGAPVEDVLARISESLGLAQARGVTVPALTQKIGDRRVLLVLDNFEHLVKRAVIFSELLRACPNLRLLATSREVLGLREERVVRLKGLKFPEGTSEVGATSYPAVALFLKQADRVGVSPGKDDLSHITRIVQAVEGLPLAIELAAAWLSALSCREIAEQLESDPTFLRFGNQDMPTRHRSLFAALDYSWRLLTAAEQAAFARLSVFRSGFTCRAACAVTAADLGTLKTLVDKSLLRYDPASSRYQLHLMLQQYAEGKLAGNPDEREVRDAHARYYLDQLQQLVDAPKRLAVESANLNAAWRWAVERRWEQQLLERTAALERFFDITARGREGAQLLVEAEAAFDEEVHVHRALVGTLRASRAWLYVRTGNYDEAVAVARQALELLRHQDRQEHLQANLTALTALGASLGSLGLFEESSACFEEALDLAPSRSRHSATALTNLGVTARQRGHYQQAMDYLLRARRIFRELDQLTGAIWVDQSLGDVLHDKGEFAGARHELTAGLELAESAGLEQWRLVLPSRLARIALSEGRIEEAEEVSRQLLKRLQGKGKRSLEGYLLNTLGEVALHRGAHASAESFFRRSLAVYVELNDVPNTLGTLVRLLEAWLHDGSNRHAAGLYSALTCRERALKMTHADRSRLEALRLEPDERLSGRLEGSELGGSVTFEELVWRLSRGARSPHPQEVLANLKLHG